MQTRSHFRLEERILSLEYRVRNFQFGRKWLQELRSNAEPFEIAYYEDALTRNQLAIDALKTELRAARQQLTRRKAHWPADQIAA